MFQGVLATVVIVLVVGLLAARALTARREASHDRSTTQADSASRDELRRRRIRAAWIDMAVMVAFSVTLNLTLGTRQTHRFSTHVGGQTVHDDVHTRFLSGWGVVLWLGTILAYFFLTELLVGQTLGKWLMGVRVSAVSGSRPSAWAILLRTLARVVDWWPFCYLLGWTFMRGRPGPPQRVGDWLAGTTVIRCRPAGQAAHAPLTGR